jgi:hypothetical protein
VHDRCQPRQGRRKTRGQAAHKGARQSLGRGEQAATASLAPVRCSQRLRRYLQKVERRFRIGQASPPTIEPSPDRNFRQMKHLSRRFTGASGALQRTGEHHGIDEFAQPFAKPLGVAFTAFRQRQISQSRVLAREAPSSLAVPTQVDRWKFFAHGFARAGTAACARTGRAGMVEVGATNGVVSSNARRGRRSLATRPVQPV